MTCPHCEGKAYIKSPQTLAYEMFRDIQRFYCRTNKKDLSVTIDSRLKSWIDKNDPFLLGELNKKFGINVNFIEKSMNDRRFENSTMYEIES